MIFNFAAMYKATLVPEPQKTGYREFQIIKGTEWSFRAQYVFTLQIGEYSSYVCLEPSKEFYDRDKFNVFIRQAIDVGQIVFGNGEKLSVFSPNQFAFWGRELLEDIKAQSFDNLKDITLSLSEDTYNRLTDECKKYNEITEAFNRSHNYLYDLTYYGSNHDSLAKTCYEFLQKCLYNAIGTQYACEKLKYYYILKSKANNYESAKIELSKLGAPELYQYEPNIPSDIKKYLMLY